MWWILRDLKLMDFRLDQGRWLVWLYTTVQSLVVCLRPPGLGVWFPVSVLFVYGVWMFSQCLGGFLPSPDTSCRVTGISKLSIWVRLCPVMAWHPILDVLEFPEIDSRFLVWGLIKEDGWHNYVASMIVCHNAITTITITTTMVWFASDLKG